MGWDGVGWRGLWGGRGRRESGDGALHCRHLLLLMPQLGEGHFCSPEACVKSPDEVVFSGAAAAVCGLAMLIAAFPLPSIAPIAIIAARDCLLVPLHRGLMLYVALQPVDH